VTFSRIFALRGSSSAYVRAELRWEAQYFEELPRDVLATQAQPLCPMQYTRVMTARDFRALVNCHDPPKYNRFLLSFSLKSTHPFNFSTTLSLKNS
jgi:hypothetical protein